LSVEGIKPALVCFASVSGFLETLGKNYHPRYPPEVKTGDTGKLHCWKVKNNVLVRPETSSPQ